VQIAKVETVLQAVHSNGSRNPDSEIIVARLKKAKQFHGQIQGLLGNPLIEHLL